MQRKHLVLIIIANVAAAVIVVLSILGYVTVQEEKKLANGKAVFDQNNDILTKTVGSYIDDMAATGQSWTNSVDAVDYDILEVIDFIDTANASENISGAAIWKDTLKGYSTIKDDSGNFHEVSYAHMSSALFAQLEDKSVHITPRYADPVTGEYVVAFYHHIYIKDDNDGKMKDGILMRIIPTSYMRERWAFTMGAYDDVTSCLMEKTGAYIVPPEYNVTDNFFESMEIRTSGVTASNLREAISDDGSITGIGASGENYYFTFNRVDLHDDWYVVSYIPEANLIGEGIDWTVSTIIIAVLGVLMVIDGMFVKNVRKQDKKTSTILSNQLETIREQETLLKEALDMAQTANSAKSNFLSNMSHDIRTPMNAIVGLTVMLTKHAEDPDRVREYARKLSSSSQHLLGLINDILDMSKIESGKTSLNIIEFNLADMVSEISTIMVPQARSKGVTFEVSTKNINNENVLGDKLKINQILINMLSNSVKYTPSGGHVFLRIAELAQEKKNFGRYVITVQDSGIGISEEYRRHIFEPFTREEKDTVNKVQGTGLGMAIAKNLVDLMGGLISVQSEMGRGTTFTVELELAIQQQEVDELFWEHHGISHVLVVDDEEEVCTNIITAMHGTGVSMQFALNGETAITMCRRALAENRNFNLVLIDWKMPGMDGIETARQIRKIIPADVPIMILTAYDWEEVEDEAREAGIDGFLTKPFFLTNFKQTIDNIKNPEQAAKNDGEDELEELIKGKHFLAAEDNEINAEILVEILEIHGATVDIAPNGKEVVEMFEKSEMNQYDAILMDIEMPVMNGLEAAKAIRASMHPMARKIPIIAMTANAFSEDVQASMDAGMNGHIAKPIDLQIVASVLKKQFSKPGV